MSSKSKGKDREDEAMEYYVAQGYKVWRPQSTSVRLPNGNYVKRAQDIMEIFDFIAWDERGIDFVQVKSHPSDASKARLKINKMGLPDLGSVEYVVLMRYPKKPGHFRRWILRDAAENNWYRDELRP